jgi:maltose O-acetyltransferase
VAAASPALLLSRCKAEARRWRERLRGDPDLTALRRRGLQVGKWVYAGRWTLIDPGFCWLISIGDNTTIGPRVTILAHDASTRNHTGYTRIDRVQIGKRVFIGAHAVILPGTVLGDDVIVGAGSVVKGVVPSGTVVAGVPARPIGSTDQYVALHTQRIEERPHFPYAGFTVDGGITQENKQTMIGALLDGPGYVE